MYESFIFCWDDLPKGGAKDLKMCCDTADEARTVAERMKREWKNVQIMDAYGDIIT